MFVLCPHCEFLVGIDPRTGQPPTACPKCGQALQVAQEDAAAVEPAADAHGIGAQEVVAPEGLASDASPTDPAPPPSAPQLDAEAVIAAMAAKPRRTRAKARTDAKAAPKQDAPPARRKRAERSPEAPAPTTADPAPALARVATPSLASRLAAWWSSRRSTQPEPRAEPKEAPAAEAPKRKASVRPIPSLRDRAAARAEAKLVSEIEALSISEAPVVVDDVRPEPAVPESPVVAMPVEPPARAATATDAPALPLAGARGGEPPVVEASDASRRAKMPVADTPVAATPVEALAAPTPVAGTPVAEAPVAEAPVSEAPAIESPAVQAPGIASAVAAHTAAAPPAAVPAPEPRATRTATAPSFLRTRPRTSAPVRWRQFATLGGLSLLLALQLLLAQRDALAADARWRPAVDALCTALRCTVPAWREPDAFTMLSRDVRPHPGAAGTLRIDASFRNDARWAQPWPRLWVSLSDIDGRVVGARAFTAAEYLGAPPTQNTLAPGQAAVVQLAVVEPAPDVVAFSFEFR